MVRTVTSPGRRPLLRSRTSKRVSVQSSPRSQRNSEPRQRSRATAVDCCARSSKRKRANVVALAKAAVRLRSSMPTKKHFQRNLLRWVKLISLHLQRAGGGGFVQICVLNEERARAGSRGGGYLQRKVNDAEASGLLGDDRDVAGPGDGVGHAGIQTAGRKQANVRGDNSGGGPLQRHRISGERARISGSPEDAKGGDVQVDIGVREGDAGGSGVDDDDVLGGCGGGGAGEGDDFIGGIGGSNEEGNAVGGCAIRGANLDGEISRDRHIRGGGRGGGFRE